MSDRKTIQSARYHSVLSHRGFVIFSDLSMKTVTAEELAEIEKGRDYTQDSVLFSGTVQLEDRGQGRGVA